MIRMLLLESSLAVLGALVGLLLAGTFGGLFGVMIGALSGVLWTQARKSTRKIPPGVPVHHESVRVLCVPTGQFADVGMTHDGEHWCDVESCSLCRPHDNVHCRKRCVELMNEGPAPRQETALA